MPLACKNREKWECFKRNVFTRIIFSLAAQAA
jgi:hypothetical protein